MSAHGVMFHHFCDARHPRGQGALSADDLVAVLRAIGPERIVSAEVWLERALAGRLGPDDVCLTFDDALLCQYDVALPILADFGVTAFWFVYSSVFEGALERLEIYRYFRTVAFPSIDAFYDAFFAAVDDSPHAGACRDALAAADLADYLPARPFYTPRDRVFRFVRDRVLGPRAYERLMDAMLARAGFEPVAVASALWLTDGHLRELAEAGHVIGLHSYSHPMEMSRLPRAAQHDEYARNFEHVRKATGRAPLTVAHPCDSYGAETLEVLRGLGIRLGFRATMAVAATSPLELPREDAANIVTTLQEERHP